MTDIDIETIDPKYTQYARDVVDGKIIAGELIKLACQRYLSWFERDDYYFDANAADKPVRFISKLRHVRGDFKGKPFILQDWQAFLVYAVYGWKRVSDDRRVIRRAYIQIARKCGKTSLASALGLYGMIADGEAGAEVVCVAPSRVQSHVAFDSATEYLESINRMNIFHTTRNEIRFPHNHAKFRILSSEDKFGDGFNPSTAILDEFHAFDKDKVLDVITSGMTMRSQPILFMITTAGFNLFSPCKIYRDMCEDILRGLKTDDTIFPLIYEMDKGDDIDDEANWKKCCPSYGITVQEDSMKGELTMMHNNHTKEVPILTKTFNVWCSSAESWLPNSMLLDATQPINLEDFKDKNIIAILGVDLASVSDLTCVSMCFNYENKFYLKTWIFLPADTIEESPNRDMYKDWVRRGLINVTPGNATDYDYVLNTILDINKYVTVWKVEYDSWNATQFTENAMQQRLKMEPFSQSLGNFNRPTKEFERRLRLGEVVIDDNEVVRWCFSNCMLKTDPQENVKPVKGGTKHGKIDAVISMLQAFGGMLYTKAFNHFFTAI